MRSCRCGLRCRASKLRNAHASYWQKLAVPIYLLPTLVFDLLEYVRTYVPYMPRPNGQVRAAGVTLTMLVLSQVYLTSQTFLTLNQPGIFYSTHAVRTHASAAAGMNRHAWTGMHEPACMDRHACCMHAACMNRHAWTGMRACMNRHACCCSSCCCCVYACVRGCPRDRHRVSADLQLGADPAWRIEFSYRNIFESYARSKGRARGAAPRARPFNRA